MNTVENILLKNSSWIEVYSATGIDAGNPIQIDNLRSDDVVFVISSTEPDQDPQGFSFVFTRESRQFVNGDLAIWVRSENNSTSINVTDISDAPIPVDPMNFGLTTEANFVDFTTQAGTATDTPRSVKYGAGQTSTNGIVNINADGTLTVLKGGPLQIKSRIRTGRTGGSGISHLFFWAEISVDGGSSYAIFGNSVMIPLDTANDSLVFLDIANGVFPAGVKLRSMFSRSSTGNDSGDLVPASPSAALQSAGVTAAPSAQLTVYRYLDQTYV